MLVVLLLCFVCVVKGGDPCTKGEDAIEVFMEMRNCEPDIREMGEEIIGPFFENATLENFRNAASGYCSLLFPAMRECFSQNIQNCSADQRAILTRVMEDTGFVCEPNSVNVHPHITHLVDHFSDADFEGDDDCELPGDIYHSVHETCYDEALAAMGFATFQEFREFLQNATVEQLMPYVPIFLNTVLECGVTVIRDMPDRCDNWRGQIFHVLKWNFFPTVLGRTMTFTTDQLDAMFEFQDNKEEGTDQSVQSLLSITFFKRP